MAVIETNVLNTKFSFFFFYLLFLATSVYSIPFVVFHGLDNDCGQLNTTISELEIASGNSGRCIEIGDGKQDSIFMPIWDQVAIACQKVKEIDELVNGYNIIGISQGNMISRGVIETCDNAPPVKNYISVGGPHAGQATAPDCYGSVLCEVFSRLLFKLPLYDACLQYHLAPTNYIKIPTDIKTYIEGCTYLPLINNEIPSAKNVIYKERFASLHNLVLVMFDNETVLVPKETSWFGYYADGSSEVVLPTNETALYKEDWIGLKALHDAGNVTFTTAPGGHCSPSDKLDKIIVKFIKDDIELPKQNNDHLFYLNA